MNHQRLYAKQPINPKLTVTLADKGRLTPRECDVLLGVCQGQSKKQIAKTVQISPSTAAKHVENIAAKMQAHSLAEIVAKAVASGLVQISYKALLLVLISQCCLLDDDHHSCPLARTRLTIRHTKREL